jgi:hypothetical protein
MNSESFQLFVGASVKVHNILQVAGEGCTKPVESYKAIQTQKTEIRRALQPRRPLCRAFKCLASSLESVHRDINRRNYALLRIGGTKPKWQNGHFGHVTLFFLDDDERQGDGLDMPAGLTGM